VVDTNVSEDLAASIFRVKKILTLHGVTTHTTLTRNILKEFKHTSFVPIDKHGVQNLIRLEIIITDL
jgi:hypothetical protein